MTIPKFSEKPFKKEKLPEELYTKIMNEYNSMNFVKYEDIEFHTGHQDYVTDSISIQFSDKPYYNQCIMSEELKEECKSYIQPLLENWCGTKLEFTSGFGIRSYVKDSVLHFHRDKVETHVISCIIFVDEKPNIGWPLDFIDHEKIHHRVKFEPGDMLFYESLCAHGRMIPFQGEYYRNMYFHFKPVDWNPEICRNSKKYVYRCLQEVLDD